jgi:stalled ribosome rescue protein Dom34
MKINVRKKDNLAFLELEPESDADMYHLEVIAKACREDKVIWKESRQWTIQGLRLMLASEN